MFGFHIYSYSIEFEVFDDSMNDQQSMVNGTILSNIFNSLESFPNSYIIS